MRHVAIVMAAGTGSRMGTNVPKQYMNIGGIPILARTLMTIEETFIDEIVLVTRADDIDYCQKEIVDKYHISKVSKIVEGGSERYLSVYKGLSAIGTQDAESQFVYIHDGARPFASKALWERVKEAVTENGATVTCVQAKDTVKVSGTDGFVKDTPDRSILWYAQTPQAFRLDIISKAFERMLADKAARPVTDDASLVEMYSSVPVKIVDGEYSNIKITTPEDMIIGEALAMNRGNFGD